MENVPQGQLLFQIKSDWISIRHAILNEKCVLCGKNFNAKRNMLKHKRNVHDKRFAIANLAGDVEQPVGGDPLNEAML